MKEPSEFSPKSLVSLRSAGQIQNTEVLCLAKIANLSARFLYLKSSFKILFTLTLLLCSITTKHIQNAMRELKEKNIKEVDADSSLLQRILAMGNDPKIASILALDMFLVGIDTVKILNISVQKQIVYSNQFMCN